jgi:hypothetical protein
MSFRLVDNGFLKKYIGDDIRSRMMLAGMSLLQRALPQFSGRHGQYPSSSLTSDFRRVTKLRENFICAFLNIGRVRTSYLKSVSRKRSAVQALEEVVGRSTILRHL